SASLTGLSVASTTLNVTPSMHDFGSVASGSSSGTFGFTIQNIGAVTASGLTVTLAGADPASFAISSNTCGASLAAFTICTLNVAFSPTTLGAKAASLTVTGSPGGTASASLTGLSVAPALSITPSMHDFGSVA